MATKLYTGYVELRGGTSAEWAAPAKGVPHVNEIVFVDGLPKIGDGTTAAVDLPAWPGGGGGGGITVVDNGDGSSTVTF